MNPAAPTPVPIHDIVGPVWFFPWPAWVVVCAAAGVLLLLAGLVWGLRSLLARKRPPTAKERALAALDALRSAVAGADPYAFGITVSDAIRNYIHGQHGLRATTQTSLEFLESIRTNPVFTDNEKAGLSVFLEKTDLLKYARAEAGESEMIGLLETAGRLVRGEVQPVKTTEGES
ncbi:MAG: DUF4381 family protein [Terrimicrobiaceae bacterium]|nr:DUF4381 family protein [Terrimicrobiaceae bacterium]